MLSPDLSTEAPGTLVPADLIEVGRYSSIADGSDHGLVVLAMGLPYWLVPANDAFALLVDRGGDATVREQLARFDRESIGWPPAPVIAPAVKSATHFILPGLWALVVLAMFWAQLRSPQVVLAGALDARAVFEQAEWWRLGSALFLHADVGHLFANTLSGIFVFSAVTTTLGTRRGWLLLMIAALAGNLAAAALRYPAPYVSIGASTAIFAGLGLLTGRALQTARRSRHPHRWRSMFVPLGAGLTVLALFGAGDQRVDVGAHLTGFTAGIVLGTAAALLAGNAERR